MKILGMSKSKLRYFLAGVTLTLLAVGGCCVAYGGRVDDDQMRVEDMKLRIEERGGEYIITEDENFIGAKFATVPFAEYHLTHKAHKELTKHIAMTIARFFHATNGQIRTGHYEYPPSAGTNAIDILIRNLGAKFVTDEIIYP